MSVIGFLQQQEDKPHLHEIRPQTEQEKPQLLFDPKKEISDSDWQGMKQELDEYREGNDWQNFSSMAMRLKLLFPERTNELKLVETDWQGMKQELDKYRKGNNWWLFSNMAMCLKLLFPEKTNELNLETAWQGMKQRLDKDRKENNWWNFSSMAMNMTILAAHRAQITRNGQIEITMLPPQTDFHAPITPRPVRRKY